MEHQTLRELLEQLHRELSEAPALDDRGRQLLVDVKRDIERLDAEDVTASASHTAAGAASGRGATTPVTRLSSEEREQIRGRWQSAVVDFEGSHPQLARGLERMAVILSNFGL